MRRCQEIPGKYHDRGRRKMISQNDSHRTISFTVQLNPNVRCQESDAHASGSEEMVKLLGGWVVQTKRNEERERERGEQKTKNHNETQTNKGREECLIAQAEDHQTVLVALGTRLCWVCGARRSFWGWPNCTNKFFAKFSVSAMLSTVGAGIRRDCNVVHLGGSSSIKCHHLWRDAPTFRYSVVPKKESLRKKQTCWKVSI